MPLFFLSYPSYLATRQRDLILSCVRASTKKSIKKTKKEKARSSKVVGKQARNVGVKTKKLNGTQKENRWLVPNL